jgi:hypothetical protein
MPSKCYNGIGATLHTTEYTLARAAPVLETQGRCRSFYDRFRYLTTIPCADLASMNIRAPSAMRQLE